MGGIRHQILQERLPLRRFCTRTTCITSTWSRCGFAAWTEFFKFYLRCFSTWSLWMFIHNPIYIYIIIIYIYTYIIRLYNSLHWMWGHRNCDISCFFRGCIVWMYSSMIEHVIMHYTISDLHRRPHDSQCFPIWNKF